MWPALLLFSPVSGLALGLARLRVLAVIPATIVLSLITGGIVSGLQWGAICLAVIAGATMLQFSYVIGGLLSEDTRPRAALA